MVWKWYGLGTCQVPRENISAKCTPMMCLADVSNNKIFAVFVKKAELARIVCVFQLKFFFKKNGLKNTNERRIAEEGYVFYAVRNGNSILKRIVNYAFSKRAALFLRTLYNCYYYCYGFFSLNKNNNNNNLFLLFQVKKSRRKNERLIIIIAKESIYRFGSTNQPSPTSLCSSSEIIFFFFCFFTFSFVEKKKKKKRSKSEEKVKQNANGQAHSLRSRQTEMHMHSKATSTIGDSLLLSIGIFFFILMCVCSFLHNYSYCRIPGQIQV